MNRRRTFLRGLVSLPLIGGGVTLIGRPAVAVPLVQAAALPDLGSPHERAKYAWEAFASSMRELTIGHSGWQVMAGERHAYRHVAADKWISVRSVDYIETPEMPKVVSTLHGDIGFEGWGAAL